MDELKRIKKTAIKAAKASGKYILEHVDKIKEVSRKGGAFTNLVTDVDKASEEMIIDAIKKDFPDHSIIAEESGEETREEEFKWIIDPLDGTTNYSHGFPFFCVSIGIEYKGEVAIGVVYDPSRDELFEAQKSAGSFLNGKAIRVSKKKKLEESLLATGFAYNVEGKLANIKNFENMLKYAQAIRRAGSAAIDLCYVACGRLDGFWEFGLSPWDTAAGQLIVSEAGGKVTKVDYKEFDVYDKQILASNGFVHDEIREALKELHI